jgi:hypothetical protein
MAARAPTAIVNELSLPPYVPELTEESVLLALADLVVVTRAIRAIRPDLSLASAAPLGGLPLTKAGLGFAAVAGSRGGIAREHWRFIQSRRNLAPFSSSSTLTIPGHHEEYRVQGQACEGMGVAASSGQLPVSLRTSTLWEADSVEVEQVWLVEDPSTGDVVEDRTTLALPHVSHEPHVETHRRFIADLALPDPFSGTDLWSDRAHRYPRLQFLPRVAAQLADLGQGSAAVRQVHDRLTELDAAAEAWKPAAETFPTWLSLVSPEGQVRKQYCIFEDLDGEERCFDLHARYTPGHGRIHFRLAAENGSPFLRVAHVGLKLGV